MESDRVEMSIGSGMVNGDHLSNGVGPNGSSIDATSQSSAANAVNSTKAPTTPYINGELVPTKKGSDGSVQVANSILQDAPPELLQVLSSEFYLPMARLISRSAQSCWNDLLGLVDRLFAMHVPTQSASNGAVMGNDQSKVNLDKKDLLLNFAKVHKDTFIKLLVLLQWSRKSEEVRKTIELNLWLQQRRQAFNNATGMLGAMLRGLADSQVPNPDLYTASEVLATGCVSSMPKLAYIPQPNLSAKQSSRILRRLNTILCTRMALADDIPENLQQYHIHDGRVTFTIHDKFSFDVSVVSEDLRANFGMVDFQFLFSPAPTVPDALHDEITRIANAALDRDGLSGVYEFLHDLTLSYVVNELTKQARKLANGLWNGHLKVEVLRRTLVVQYWLKNSMHKSWLELGIHSGKVQNPQGTNGGAPGVKLRWMRDGKMANSDDIQVNISALSMEDILLQVVAQHTNHLFDAVYDRLISYPLYDTAELELTQSISSQDPAECSLRIQLSKTDVLQMSIEPIGGSLILSPVNERISRIQFDLARSKNVVDDLVSRISGLRSSTAETNLTKSLPNSQWLRLEGIKVSSADAEKLFGISITRVSLLRLPGWAQEWMLAVTQSATGDLWWLIQTTQPNRLTNSRITRIVENHPLNLVGRPSPKYLERLAYYSTGVIALRCNADYLSKSKTMWTLPDVAAFDGESRLPALQFNRSSALGPSTSTHTTGTQKGTKVQANGMSLVKLSYHSIKQLSKKVVMHAATVIVADAAVLRDLASSQLDRSVTISPEKQLLTVELEAEAGTPVIETLLSKLSHLENIVACAAAVRRSTEHTLQSLSLSSIAILYHQNPDLSLQIDFGRHSSHLSATFLPTGTNPQNQLSPWVVKTMQQRSATSSQNLSNVFVVLKMTLPIMSYLHEIQSQAGLSDSESPGTSPFLRVHVIHRQPSAYALQYLSSSSNFTRTESGPGTPKKLLARFEILSLKDGDRLMWLVRPSVEEFNSYNRPSYTSQTLREKLDRDVFKKQSPLWLKLDGGAACPADKPAQLLSAIHTSVLEWAKGEIKPETAPEQNSKATTGPPADVPNDKHLNRPNQAPQQPHPQKVQNMQQRPNGIPKSQPINNQQRPQPFTNRFQGSKPSEVITLE